MKRGEETLEQCCKAIQWGIPDWRSSSAYPRPESITIREWWWQFTRRHPEFRRIWLEVAPRQAAYIENNKRKLAELAEMTGVPTDEYLVYKLDQAPLPGDPGLIRRRFQINRMLNPAKDFTDDYLRSFHDPDGAWAIKYPVGRVIHERDVEGGRRLLSFNLIKPLDRQLKFAKEFLEEEQRELTKRKVVRRPHKMNWPLFLRALDAKEVAGATYRDMAGTFWPGRENKREQSARDTYDQAVQLRNNFPI